MGGKLCLIALAFSFTGITTLTWGAFPRPHPGCSGRTECDVRGGQRDSGKSGCGRLDISSFSYD